MLLVPSWGGQPREQLIADEILARGWAVLKSAPPTFSRSRCVFTIDNDRSIANAAREAAQLIDARTADAAYAAKAILACLKEHRPDLPQEPFHVVGFSAGSLVVPAIVHRLAGRVRGFVLVGSGADLLDAGSKSSWDGQPIRVRWEKEQPLAEDRRLLQSTYRQCAALDPFNLAPALRDVPALLLLGSADRIVPSENGELLYRRLGRPDCYRFPFGHPWLFLRLPAFASVIADWIEPTATAGG